VKAEAKSKAPRTVLSNLSTEIRVNIPVCKSAKRTQGSQPTYDPDQCSKGAKKEKPAMQLSAQRLRNSYLLNNRKRMAAPMNGPITKSNGGNPDQRSSPERIANAIAI